MSEVRIKLNSAGIRQMLKSEEMQAAVEAEASRRAEGLGEGYTVNTYVGRNRCNAEIRAESYQARKDNLRNNTLLRVIS